MNGCSINIYFLYLKWCCLAHVSWMVMQYWIMKMDLCNVDRLISHNGRNWMEAFTLQDLLRCAVVAGTKMLQSDVFSNIAEKFIQCGKVELTCRNKSLHCFSLFPTVLPDTIFSTGKRCTHDNVPLHKQGSCSGNIPIMHQNEKECDACDFDHAGLLVRDELVCVF